MSTVVVNRGAARTAPTRARRVPLGPGLRQAWVGYQCRLDDEMAAAGFDDRGFPDTRVLRMCADPAEMTISEIGRQLGITRQGAAKVVASLRDRKYVTVTASKTSGREKVVKLTPPAEHLETFRKVTRRIERQLRNEVGADAFDALARLLDALGGRIAAAHARLPPAHGAPRRTHAVAGGAGGRGEPALGVGSRAPVL